MEPHPLSSEMLRGSNILGCSLSILPSCQPRHSYGIVDIVLITRGATPTTRYSRMTLHEDAGYS